MSGGEEMPAAGSDEPKQYVLAPLFGWRSAIVESTLKPTQRLVALALSLHMNERGGSCFPSVETVASETALHYDTVRRILRELADGGWLERTVKRRGSGRGTRIEYRAATPTTSVKTEGEDVHRDPAPHEDVHRDPAPLTTESQDPCQEYSMSTPSLDPLSEAVASDDRSGPVKDWVIDGATGEEWFERFYSRHPRKGSKNGPYSAHDAFMRAVRRDGLQEILDGHDRWRQHWTRDNTGMQYIPFAASWLNKRQYQNPVTPTSSNKAASAAQAAANNDARQRDEAEQAVADGNAELAWKIVVDKAATRSETDWFAEVAKRLDRYTDEQIVITTRRSLDEIRAVRAQREQLRARALSQAALQQPTPPTPALGGPR